MMCKSALIIKTKPCTTETCDHPGKPPLYCIANLSTTACAIPI